MRGFVRGWFPQRKQPGEWIWAALSCVTPPAFEEWRRKRGPAASEVRLKRRQDAGGTKTKSCGEGGRKSKVPRGRVGHPQRRKKKQDAALKGGATKANPKARRRVQGETKG